MKRGFLSYLTVCLLLGLVLAQCGSTAEPTATQPPAAGEEETVAPEPTEAPAPPEETTNVFVYAHGTTFPDIDPAVSFSNDSAVVSNCYETLTF
jgi:hypothetical protein